MAKKSANPDDVVIVGMSCRYAGIATPSELWQAILEQKSNLGEHPDATLADRVELSPVLSDRTPRLRGGYLRDLYACDPEALGLSADIPEGENADPLFAAQLAVDALRDAGLTPKTLPTDRVAVLMGYAAPLNAGTVNWLQHALAVDQTTLIVQRFFPSATEADLASIRQQLKDALPPIQAHTIRSAYGHALAARVAGMLGVSGASCAIDGGSLSALVAVRTAMDNLRAHRCDIALAGALQGPLSFPALVGLSSLLEQTPRDVPVPLCRDADGTLYGEGGGVLVLRRRHDAERTGDRVYAAIKGIGLTTCATPVERQADHDAGGLLARAMGEALRESEALPETIDLIEAHGSGVPREDAAEIQALREICGERRGVQPTIGTGSIKSTIGHVLTAAGMAGMQKAALAIYHRVLPPSARYERPHPRLCHPRSPFYLVSAPRPWIRGRSQTPRRAGVSAMDFAGVYGHAVLEAHPEGV
jgi:acyl transferase domain-containing protein